MPLHPSVYDWFPIYGESKLKERLEQMPFHLATQLTDGNLAKCLKSPKGIKGIREHLAKDFDTQRKLLGETIRDAKMSKPIARAVSTVKRHLFAREDTRPIAYINEWLPFKGGHTLSAPFCNALFMRDLKPAKGQTILEIGIGSGYHAALVSETLNNNCEIFGIELDEEYQAFGEKCLRETGYDNIKSIQGDGTKGWPGKVEFDRIYLPCSFIKFPPALVEQLKEGGLIQGQRQLTREEVAQESSNHWWRKWAGLTYESYLNRWRHSTALSTYRKEDGQLVKVSDIYHFWYVALIGSKKYAGSYSFEGGDLTPEMRKLLAIAKEPVTS
ncbi:protein-L-isoaspartate O-methyltransferase [Candidatus Micrarchaeota archaeon]|nr:protein-L-isoaspartate O-methyltransferase [Candidatus Micrarchaeota archaeon]